MRKLIAKAEAPPKKKKADEPPAPTQHCLLIGSSLLCTCFACCRCDPVNAQAHRQGGGAPQKEEG
jgi:hypothetical protein